MPTEVDYLFPCLHTERQKGLSVYTTRVFVLDKRGVSRHIRSTMSPFKHRLCQHGTQHGQ